MEPADLAVLPAALSAYERRALAEIALWKQNDMGWFGKVVGGVNHLAGRAADVLRKLPGVAWTIDHLAAGILDLLNEIVQDSVNAEAGAATLRKAGLPVDGLDAMAYLDLETVDGLTEGLATRYRSLAAAEGAAAGMAGAAGILPDVLAVAALNLRAAGSYAAAYGFDIRLPEERLFALQVLDAMSHPSDAAKQLALTPVWRASTALAQGAAAEAAGGYAVTKSLQNVARKLGIHLAEAKLAQIVPATGALIAGGFNAYYTSKVCDACAALYRERFLVRKYGPAAVAAALSGA